MRKHKFSYKFESGQVIPLVVGIIFLIFFMVALLIDGGAIISNRRTAQAAADAGALAGAQRACYGFGAADAELSARTYATNNGATTVDVPVVTGSQVTVVATVENDSFFARIFSEDLDRLSVAAEATAGCFGPRGRGVVPVTWRCWPPEEGKPFDPKYGCQMQTVDWDTINPLITGSVSSFPIADFNGNVKDYHIHTDGTSIVRDPDLSEGETLPVPPSQIYIIFDGDKLCVEDAGIGYICDLDGDGKKDLQLGGDRGLIYLTSSTSNINQWITSDTTPPITLAPHVWLTAQPGMGSAILKMETSGWAGAVVLFPVFNEICTDRPDTTPACIANAHAHPPWPVFTGEDRFDMKTGGSLWYHIIAFQPFYISCVSKSGDCPGYRHAQTINPDLKNNVPVLEGMFLSGYDYLSLDANNYCDINLGNCRLSLSE